MREGQHGFCFIRQNVGGQLVQLAYGKLSGLSADPIEKKPLYHFYPGSLALSFGTAGCNLACKFCQNWGISKAKRMQILSQDAPPDDIARLAKHFGCRSVAYTYNDPIVFAEYAIDTAQACRDAGIANVAVSAGYISKQARGPFFSPMDAANIDLKSFNPDFYRKVTGAELSVVLDNLAWLRSTPVRLEITTLLIPGMNDSDSEILALTKWVRDNLSADVPLHFSAFHPAYRMQDVGRTPPSTVRRARELALDVGLEYVYTGNIADTEGSTTYCPACGATVIARDGYRVTVNNLVDNCCPACGKRIPGRFSQADAALGT
jgi:pyruvate formate lyase activating enzyme